MATKETMKNLNSVDLKHVPTVFRTNFAGAPDNFNPRGCTPNFCVRLPVEKAQELEKLGWNVHWRASRDPEEPDFPHIQIKVNMNSDYPPEVLMVRENGVRIEMDAESLCRLDRENIIDVSVRMNPYFWENNGKYGVTAYVNRLNVYVEDDPFLDD